MSEPEHITVCDGKYTLIMEPMNMRALRYGEPWRDLVGDGFVMALGQEISALREALSTLADEVFGRQLGDEPDIYADHDHLIELERRTRTALGVRS